MKPILLLLVVLGLLGRPAASQPTISAVTGKIISVSDIHFTPVTAYDISVQSPLISKLLQTPVKQWADTLRLQSSSYWPPVVQYGKKKGKPTDTNYWLLKATLDKMAVVCSQPDVILITGDFLGHNLSDTNNFPAGAATTDTLLIRINEFLVQEIGKKFPNTIVLPCLGNNDTNQGNYGMPTAHFLKRFAQVWVGLQHNSNTQIDRDFVTNFMARGYYAFTLPLSLLASKRTVLMLNTVPFSTSTRVHGYLSNYVSDELSWLKTELGKTGADHLWVAMHIPPGTSGFNNTSTAALTWLKSASKPYLALVSQYKATIAAELAGHTHMDEFRVRYQPPTATQPATPDAFVRVTAAVSPLFGNNPSFQVIDYDLISTRFQNISVQYLPLELLKSKVKATDWTAEYDFNSAYHTSAIDTSSLRQAQRRITDDKTYASRYQRFYGASSHKTTGKVKDNWPDYLCAISSMTSSEYNDCYQQHKSKKTAAYPVHRAVRATRRNAQNGRLALKRVVPKRPPHPVSR